MLESCIRDDLMKMQLVMAVSHVKVIIENYDSDKVEFEFG